MPKKKHIDPEVERYYRKFPKFPGLAKCVELLHSRNVRGSYLDTILYEIRIHAETYLNELIAHIRNDDSHVGTWLLAQLAEARLPDAEGFFIECLQSTDSRRRYWAIIGLKDLDTKSSRQALWYARQYVFDTPEATEEFRRTIDSQMDWS
jgi:hypothetical protein